MQKKIFLWSAPRSISSAFERCIMEVNGSKVIHEPYANPYYFGPERQSRAYLSQEVDSKSTYKNVESLLSKEYDGVDLIFSKNLAFYIENNFEILLAKELSDFQHTFLIRDPRRTVPKYYNVIVNSELTDFHNLVPNEVGIKQLYDLYMFAKTHFNIEPIVVDASDLLLNPEETMKAYFRATGIPFDQKILTWNSGMVPEWNNQSCAGWHDSVMKTTGFIKQQREAAYEDLSNYPEEVKKSVDYSLPYYQLLKEKKIKICSSTSS